MIPNLSFLVLDFNPHSHKGSDVIKPDFTNPVEKISIHTPTKGATVSLEYPEL